MGEYEIGPPGSLVHFEFQGSRLSNVPVEPWWDFGDHRGWSDISVEKEAEQVSVLHHGKTHGIHFCVQYQGWKSCKYMTCHEYDQMYANRPQAEMELVQSEINFLKSMYT